jgi:DNA-binding phage protein
MRPTDYNPEILASALNYLENFKELGDVVPTVAGMACEIGISRETIYAWAKDETKPEFSDILMRVMEKQERNLVNGGLAGGFNPAVTKMMLTKHGYSDKSEVEQSVTVHEGQSLAERLSGGSKR